MDYLYLLIGLGLLIFSAEKLVKNAVSLAKYFRVSDLIIGATIVSIGTSAPELFVSATAAFNGFSEIAIGNIIGSNIANIGFVLAISGLIVNIKFPKKYVNRDLMILLIISLLFILFLHNYIFSRLEGIIFIVLFILYIFYNIKNSKDNNQKDEIIAVEKKEVKIQKPLLSVIFIIISSVGLMLGSNLMVESSVNIAKSFGVSERIIAITMLAIGTSLPELVTSVVAAFKKNSSIIIGNVIGSNILNLLLIGGVSATINPLKISYSAFNIDVMAMLLFVVVLILLLIIFSKYSLGKIKSLILLLLYFAFIGILV